MECLTGYTPEKEGIFLLRAGCGFHFDQGVLVKINQFIFARGHSIAGTAQDPGHSSLTKSKYKHFYAYFEVVEMGKSAGVFKDGVLGGGRYFFPPLRGHKWFRLFGGALAGGMRPLPSSDDPAPEWALTALAAAGLDVGLFSHRFAIRGEVDRVGTSGVHPHTRFTLSGIVHFKESGSSQ
jgi:hypothetical protein